MAKRIALVHGRTVDEWALTALKRGVNKANSPGKSQADAIVSLRRGIHTASMWLDGTHPKLQK